MTAPSQGPDTSAFTKQFVEEARDRLKALGVLMLRLEDQPESSEIIADVFREAHSLKGSSQMLGFVDISQIAHQLEDLFVAAKRDARIIDARAFDVVFRTIDVISARVEALALGGVAHPDPDLGGDLAALATDTEPAAARPRGRTIAPPTAARAPVATLRVSVEKLESLAHLAPEMVIQRLKASERHAELRRVESMLGRLRDRIREERLAPPTRSRAAELGDYADALDALNRRLRALSMLVGEDQARLSLITEELRQHVIELTMLPIATVFDAFPRAVRDLARSFDKDVELTMIGGETALDKRVIEQITDPLVHLVRNAIDHGLETPVERERDGKPGTGALLIAAEQHGSRIHITVRDDGRGIDPDKVRAAAVRKGLANEAEAAEWSEERVFNLIFEPGFSTRTETTDVSGRGVGMDVVRVVADRLGGSVRVESEIGRGTTVLLDLPLSLALLRVVLVEVNDELVAIPTAPISRILHVARGAIIESPSGTVILIDGDTIPIAPLQRVLGLPGRARAAAEETALIIEARGTRVAITVDGVLEEQELVFQELRGPLQRQSSMAGAAILGNGDIVPILDIQTLSARVASPPAVDAKIAPAAAPGAVASARVLVVEDSLVAGDLLKGILIGAGYDAAIAHDGIEALEMLRRRPCELVISDVDMPNMDGFVLTEQMRADPHLRSIPLIIVTSRDSEEYRQRGRAAGADAYVTKGAFDQNQVLETVRRLIAVGRGVASGAHAERRDHA
jgi:two-component system chemotaxis sensor kinase CheA